MYVIETISLAYKEVRKDDYYKCNIKKIVNQMVYNVKKN